MQVDLAAIIGDRVGRGLAIRLAREIAAAHEVAIIVVALEEAVEVVVHVSFVAAAVLGGVLGGLGLLHRLGRSGSGAP